MINLTSSGGERAKPMQYRCSIHRAPTVGMPLNPLFATITTENVGKANTECSRRRMWLLG